MKIKVSEIPQRGSVVNFNLASEDLESRINAPGTSPKFYLTGPASAEGVAHLSSGSVNFSASYQLGLKTECTRCLNTVDFPISESFDMVFKPISEDEESEQIPDIGLDYYSDDTLNCEEVVQEQIAINLPENPTCELSGRKCSDIKTTWGEDTKTQSLGSLLKKAGLT